MPLLSHDSDQALLLLKSVQYPFFTLLIHIKSYLQRSYLSEYKRDRTNAFITISIEVSTNTGYGC